MPTFTCRSTAVAEIVGDSALFVYKDNVVAVFEALLALKSQAGLPADLICRGQRQAQTSTLSACVARLQAALENKGE